MSDEQPARSPDDLGPDWWPRFGWRLAGLWFLQGFLIPLAVFCGVWLVATIGISFSTGSFFSEDTIRQAGTFAILGFFLSGGTLVLTWIFSKGARWSTLLRTAGLVCAVIFEWTLSRLILGIAG